jgi:hypothetical protein
MPWGRNQLLLDRLDTCDLREWYAGQAILLCTSKSERIVRYALGRSTSPMAVSGYRYTELPDDERRLLPGEAELTAVVDAALSQFDAS